MPDPVSTFATDHLVYNYICNPIAKHICFISPNFITFLCFLCIFPITYNLYINASLPTLLFWVILRGILDCLDGAAARRCKTSSPLGAKLDIMNDALSLLVVFAVIFVKLINTKYYWLLILPTAYIFSFLPLVVKTNLQAELEQNKFARFVHDNTVLNAIIATLIIKYILNSI